MCGVAYSCSYVLLPTPILPWLAAAHTYEIGGDDRCPTNSVLVLESEDTRYDDISLEAINLWLRVRSLSVPFLYRRKRSRKRRDRGRREWEGRPILDLPAWKAELLVLNQWYLIISQTRVNGARRIGDQGDPGKKKRQLRWCIKSEHCSYHGISKTQAWLRFGAAMHEVA